MKKLTTIMLLAAGMMLGAWADDRDRIQLWENGPYWAETNIGAEKPEDSGYYFWWGDTVGYTWENEQWVATSGGYFRFNEYKINQQTDIYSKSIDVLQSEGWVVSEDDNYVLAPQHDAAQMKWGDGWRMPTIGELADLSSMCDWTLMTTNGMDGYIVRGRGNYAVNSIFLPLAGFGSDNVRFGFSNVGYYWSSVPALEEELSKYLVFDKGSDRDTTYSARRDNGMPIRPVNDAGREALDTEPPPEPVAPPAPPSGGSVIAAGPRPVFVGVIDDGVASVWDGWTVAGGDAIGGVLQVKVGKSNGKKPSKVTATLVPAVGKKLSFKGEMDGVDANTAVLKCRGQADMRLEFGEKSLKGAFDGEKIVGARNLFMSKDKQEAKDAEATLAPYLGAVNIAFEGGNLSLSIAKKGKVKASGLVDGVKVSANAQLIIGDDGLAIPVVVAKKVNLAFLVWLAADGVTVEGLDGVEAAGAPQPKDSLTFSLGAGFGTVAGVQAGLLPTAFAFGGGLKWSFRKADTVKLNADKTAAEVTKDNGNPSGLKLTYKPKDGSFKGKLTVYAVEGGKLKKYTANVTGVMIGGKGYGTATVKKPAASAEVTIE